jgi:hypothetical protein
LEDEHGDLEVGACGDKKGFKTVVAGEVVVFDRDSQVELDA